MKAFDTGPIFNIPTVVAESSRAGSNDVALSSFKISSTDRVLNPTPDASFIAYKDALLCLAQDRRNEEAHAMGFSYEDS